MFEVYVNFLQEDRIIELSTRGVIDIAADRELVATGRAAAQQYGSTKFLVDHRYVEIKLRMIDIEDVEKIADRAGVPPGTSIALLYNDTQITKDLFTYLDDLSYLHGGPRRSFTDRKQAVEWLKSRN